MQGSHYTENVESIDIGLRRRRAQDSGTRGLGCVVLLCRKLYPTLSASIIFKVWGAGRWGGGISTSGWQRYTLIMIILGVRRGYDDMTQAHQTSKTCITSSSKVAG